MNKILLTGNEAIAEGAILAGCRFYAGYPITPQNEICSYMAERMPEVKGVFIQAESEISAINMVLGAAAVGVRAMTSSSSPGMSLKQEGISYLAGCQLPAVIVNIMRGGPGLGNIAPSQSDYFQATKGGGHGDYRCIVLAPSTVQEAFDFTHLGFYLADKYRNPTIILGDGMLGQMAEPLTIDTDSERIKQSKKLWALTGCKEREPNLIRSLYIAEERLEELNLILQEKYGEIKEREECLEEYFCDDVEIILVSYGTMARICRSVVKRLRGEEKKIGLIRPITLWPFPEIKIKEILVRLKRLKYLLVVEMSYGQMYEDVRLTVDGRIPVEFLGRAGGGIPNEEEIIDRVKKLGKLGS